jgi:hypothetical protein
MTLFDLLFLILIVSVIGAALRVVYLSIRRRFRPARKTLIRLLLFVAAYMLVLVGFSLAEPQRRIAMGVPQCFDDWCITVEKASRQTAIRGARPHGNVCVVTLRVSSRASGRPQRETDVRVYLLDDQGRRFDVSAAGQRQLEQQGQAGMPITSFVAPGGSFESRLAFDVPADAQQLSLVKTSWAWFPFRLIIGGPESWLHRPTVVPLQFGMTHASGWHASSYC